nr:uncharacterized protein LOC116147340 [Camelus dromedarius]
MSKFVHPGWTRPPGPVGCWLCSFPNADDAASQEKTPKHPPGWSHAAPARQLPPRRRAHPHRGSRQVCGGRPGGLSGTHRGAPPAGLATAAAGAGSRLLGTMRPVRLPGRCCSRGSTIHLLPEPIVNAEWQRGPHRPWWGAGPSSQEKGWCEWLVPAVPKIPRTKLYDRTCIHSPTPPASRELQELFCGLSLDLQSTPESFRQQVTLSRQRPLCSDAPRLPHGAGAEHLGTSLRGPRKTLTATRHQGNGRGEHRPNTPGWL